MSSTPSSERPQPWYLRPVGMVGNGLLTGLIAVGLLTAAVTDPESRNTSIVTGTFMGSVSLMSWLSVVRERHPWSIGELDGRPAWRLRLGPSRAAALGVLVVTLTMVGWLIYYLAERASNGRIAVAVIFGLLALLLLVLNLALALTILRAPALLVSADRLLHDGAGVRAELAWDDVGVVDWSRATGRWAALRLSAATDATSYRATRRWSPLPLDRVPPEPGIELRLSLLPDPTALMRLLRELHAGGRPTRESLIARGLPADSGR